MKLYALIILIGATMHANAQAGSTVSKTFNGVKSLPTSTSMRMHEEKEGNILFLEETGKEGYFKYDRKDKVSLDNEGTVIVSRTGKRYKRVYDGNLSVAWFGAKGDGKTDDTQAFIKAIASGSNVIYIPYKAGGYRISNVPVNRTVTLKGDNKFNTIIRPAANNVSCFVTQNQFVEYHHLYFDGTGTTNTVGIEHKHRISTINSCFFSGFQKGIFNNKNFVEGGKPDEQIIINSRFRSCEYGIYSDGHFINSKILNSIFHGCTRSAIFCTDNSYLASTLTTEGLLIERCLVYDSGDPLGNTAAVDIRNLDFTFIRNCMFDINNHTALSLLNSQNCNLSGTYFSAAMAMGPSSSAKITGNCSNSTIEGCQFYDSKNWGLELTAAGGRQSDNIRISNSSGRLNIKGDLSVNGGTNIWVTNSNFYSNTPTNVYGMLGAKTSIYIRSSTIAGGIAKGDPNVLIDLKDCPDKPTSKRGGEVILTGRQFVSFPHGLTVLPGQKVMVMATNGTNFEALSAKVSGNNIIISRAGNIGSIEVSYSAEVE